MKDRINGNEVAQLLKSKPEIDTKVDFGKSILLAKSEQIEAIKELLEKGKKGFFGRKKLSALEAAKFKIELAEAERDLHYNKKFFEHWLGRAADYEKRYSKIKEDFDNQFPELLETAKGIKNNIRLVSAIETFEKTHEELDERAKIEFFLYIKQELQNASDHKQNSKKGLAKLR
jgi:hypothetical protein